MNHNTEKNIMDLNELIDRAFGAKQAVAPTEMEKQAAAELEDRQTAIEIIARAAELNQESLDDVDFDQLPTDHLVKTASSILEEIDASQNGDAVQEPTLELSPRLQYVLANDPEALAKFASLDPDHQHMMVCGDILGETAARSFLAAINGQDVGQTETASISQEKLAALDAEADQLAYAYLVEQGLIQPEGEAVEPSDEDITIHLAQQKIAAFLNQR